MKKRTIKVLAIGLAAAGLSAGLAATALAASGSPATARSASAAALSTTADSARADAAKTASSPDVTMARLTAEIRQLEALQAAGRASAAQIVRLHQLESGTGAAYGRELTIPPGSDGG